MFGGACSKYLNSAGQSHPYIGGSSQRYQLPPNSSRESVNAFWNPGNGPVEKISRKPFRASGMFATS